jgi:hypothetical protein
MSIDWPKSVKTKAETRLRDQQSSRIAGEAHRSATHNGVCDNDSNAEPGCINMSLTFTSEISSPAA